MAQLVVILMTSGKVEKTQKMFAAIFFATKNELLGVRPSESAAEMGNLFQDSSVRQGAQHPLRASRTKGGVGF